MMAGIIIIMIIIMMITEVIGEIKRDARTW